MASWKSFGHWRAVFSAGSVLYTTGLLAKLECVSPKKLLTLSPKKQVEPWGQQVDALFCLLFPLLLLLLLTGEPRRGKRLLREDISNAKAVLRLSLPASQESDKKLWIFLGNSAISLP